MKRLLLACAAVVVLLLVPLATHADPITLSVSVDLGPTGVITSGQWPDNPSKLLSMPLDCFTGALLDGSIWDLEILFADGEFLRVFTASGQLDLGLTFYTDVDSGQFLGDGTSGGIIDQDGIYSDNVGTGRARFYGGDRVGFNVGLFPDFLADGTWSGERDRPYDSYGVYYHLLFPVSPGVRVTGAEFNVYMGGSIDALFVGVGPGVPPDIVPDVGSTLLLLGLGLAGVRALRKRWR